MLVQGVKVKIEMMYTCAHNQAVFGTHVIQVTCDSGAHLQQPSLGELLQRISSILVKVKSVLQRTEW